MYGNAEVGLNPIGAVGHMKMETELFLPGKKEVWAVRHRMMMRHRVKNSTSLASRGLTYSSFNVVCDCNAQTVSKGTEMPCGTTADEDSLEEEIWAMLLWSCGAVAPGAHIHTHLVVSLCLMEIRIPISLMESSAGRQALCHCT